MLDEIAGRIILAEGRARALIAVLAGALASLALPPLGATPVLFIALPVLVWLLDGAEGVTRAARGRSAFAAGWWFGTGYFIVSLCWIANAFFVEAETFGWMAPFAVVLLAMGLALFHGAGTLLARMLWSDGAGRIAATAAGLGAAEWARGHVLTGFPWNAPGMALAAYEAPMQAASLVGVHGLTILTVLIFAAPAALSPRGGRVRRAAPVAGLLLLAGLWGWGLLRPEARPLDAAGLRGLSGGTVVRIVQPAIPQAEKWAPGNAETVLQAHLDLTREGPAPIGGVEARPLSEIDAVVWPESAFPFVLVETPSALARLIRLTAEGPALLTGALRVDRDDEGEEGAPTTYNSLYAIRPEGVVEAYDKTHLVPFGEYLPFQDVLEAWGLRQLTHLQGGFTPGRARRVMDVEGLPPFQPLICYEAIFPGMLFGRDEARPDWLLNVTNDAWFSGAAGSFAGVSGGVSGSVSGGVSEGVLGRVFGRLGPEQHLAHARLRAVEEGLPLVRAANTGVSAVFDAYGRTVARMPVGARGAIDAVLPRPLEPTLYARLRGSAPAGLLLLVALGAWAGRIGRD